MPDRSKDLLIHLPAAVACSYALLFRLWFWPANLSFDSFQQIQQAMLGTYNDHHPPLMALTLALLLRLGFGIATMVSLQLVAGLLCLWMALRALARLLLPGLDARRRTLTTGLTMLAVVSPLTPFLFYMLTFWKDSWVAIGLLALLAALLAHLTSATKGDRGGSAWRVSLVVATALPVLLARHNAVILLPVVCAALGAHAWRQGARRAIALALAPALLFAASSVGMRRVFAVERVHLENVTLVHDLYALCVLDRTRCGDVPYTLSHYAKPNVHDTFEVGNVISVIRDGTRAGFDYSRTDEALLQEWSDSWRRYPLGMAAIRLRSWASVLNLREGPHYYFQPDILPNDGGFAHDPRFAAARSRVVALTEGIASLPLLRVLLGSHLLWFAASVLGTAAYTLRSWRRREFAAETVLFALPLAYYLSYLVPAATADFRYMWPATLLLECAALVALIGRAAGRARSEADALDRAAP